MEFNAITMLWHVINAVILFIAIRFLLYKPIMKFMDARERRVAETINGAEQERLKAGEMVREAQESVRAAKAAEAEVAENGARIGQQRAEALIASAKEQAQHIITQAKHDGEDIKRVSAAQMESDAAQLSIAIAEKVLEREVNAKDHERMIRQFLEKVG